VLLTPVLEMRCSRFALTPWRWVMAPHSQQEGTVVCWGFNHQGELGLGDTQDRSMPTPVPSFDGLFLTCIAARVSQVLAISCGDLYVWGLPYSYAPAVHVPRRLAGPAEHSALRVTTVAGGSECPQHHHSGAGATVPVAPQWDLRVTTPH